MVQAVFHRDSGSKIRSKFHWPIFASFVQSKIPLSLVSFLFLWSETIRMVFLCKFITLFALLFCPSDCELCFTMNWISEKSIGNTCKIITLRVNHAFQDRWYSLLFFGFAVSSTMGSAFLDHVVRDRECIQSSFVKLSSGFALNQALSASAVHNSLIPIKRTSGTLYFWCSFAQLE